MIPNAVPRILASIVSVALVVVQIPATTAADGSALKGHILLAGANAPLAGAKVHLGEPRTGAIVTSAPSVEDGSFLLANVAPGAYQIGVESNGRLYVVESPVQLASGQTKDINLQVREDAAPTAKDEDNKRKKKGGGIWDNPVTASLIVVGSALAVGLIINGLQDDSKPSGTVSGSEPVR